MSGFDPQETVGVVFNLPESGHSRILGKHTASSTKSIQPDPIDFLRRPAVEGLWFLGSGFINPYLYAFGTCSSYTTDFHDITSGKSGSFSAVTGYDLVTGWGSPNGQGLINALVGEK